MNNTIAITNSVLFTHKFTSLNNTTRISFTDIDSILIAVNGDGSIYSFEYDSAAETFTTSSDRLLVRDLWGVEDLDGTTDLRLGNNIATRPSTLSDTHLYNLRNQSFGLPRPTQVATEALEDPITEFQSEATDYPSNADSVNYALYPNASDSTNPQLERFWPKDLFMNKVGSFESAKGYFIIDLLNRGASRLSAESANRSENTDLTHAVTTLPTDSTAGGATVVSQFSGHTFFCWV